MMACLFPPQWDGAPCPWVLPLCALLAAAGTVAATRLWSLAAHSTLAALTWTFAKLAGITSTSGATLAVVPTFAGGAGADFGAVWSLSAHDEIKFVERGALE